MRELVNVARLNDPFPSAWSAASRAYVAAHQDTFARYVKSIAQAVAAEVADPNQTQQILGKYIQITDPSMRARQLRGGCAVLAAQRPTGRPGSPKRTG
jgi:ABC-type nitrate/sulfonate/bicarbonate transport system substrate-binding protein